MNPVNYEDLATGEGAETAKEKCIRWAKKKENALKIIRCKSEMNDDVELLSPRPSSLKLGHEVTRRCKKRRISVEFDVEVKMLKALQSIASALCDSLKVNDDENYIINCLWKDLVAIGVEKPLLYDAYLFLAENSKMRTAFIGCPKESRFDLLMRMLKK